MNRKKLRALVAALLVAGAAHAEGVREARPNIVEIELFGRGLLYSVAFERYFNQYVGAGVGVGAVPCFDKDLCTGTGFVLPVFVSVNPLGDEHSLYLSGGATLAISSDFTHPIAMLALGYQLQLRGGFVLRPIVQLLVSRVQATSASPSSFILIPWGGLTIGYSF
jgi:hypothetical protein